MDPRLPSTVPTRTISGDQELCRNFWHQFAHFSATKKAHKIHTDWFTDILDHENCADVATKPLPKGDKRDYLVGKILYTFTTPTNDHECEATIESI